MSSLRDFFIGIVSRLESCHPFGIVPFRPKRNEERWLRLRYASLPKGYDVSASKLRLGQ